jgi:hypothetical protein
MGWNPSKSNFQTRKEKKSASKQAKQEGKTQLAARAQKAVRLLAGQ